MESYIQLTPLNNYLSNCVIKLHMKLLTPNLPLSNCVIKLNTKLHTLAKEVPLFLRPNAFARTFMQSLFH